MNFIAAVFFLVATAPPTRLLAYFALAAAFLLCLGANGFAETVAAKKKTAAMKFIVNYKTGGYIECREKEGRVRRWSALPGRAKILQRPQWGQTGAPIGVDTCYDTPTRNDNAIRIGQLATNKSLARRRGTRGFHHIQRRPSPKRNVPRPLGLTTAKRKAPSNLVSAAVNNLPPSNFHYD